ncbi:hypothetical protein DDZ13_08905 [Coraliomargarita sinensis]|uniref:Uncharacterized protein n=1 Tax=Coraliomargarita sinensis TaxID=2174842 RepID=A0A317ZJQ4_9BACT|nr:hypothetical protein DDZ13_08905 [Coraliomargarita sinensis]
MVIFGISIGHASETKTKENVARNQLEAYMLAYVIDQHVLRSEENKSKAVLVGLGDYLDEKLKSPEKKSH